LYTAFFRFYAELNDFIIPSNRQQIIPYHYNFAPSIKDAIEAQGVPHPEVALILIDGRAVTFEQCLNSREQIAVYPHFRQIKSDILNKLRPPRPGKPKFLTDQNLGKLTKKLRLLGLDTVSFSTNQSAKFIALANTEERIILTRSIGLLKNKSVVFGYWIRHEQILAQVQEILNRFPVKSYLKPFGRCSICNGCVFEVEKEKIAMLLPSRTKTYFNDFNRCENCGQIYWKGSHYQRIDTFIKQLTT